MAALVTGIGGISRSGKSFLAAELHSRLTAMPGVSCVVLSQDEFVRPEGDIPRIEGHTDWEVPASIDFVRLVQALQDAASESDHVIVEGLLAFADSSLNRRYDKRIFIELEEEEFLRRKREDLRWGREPEWYVRHIWDAHQAYGRPPDMGSYLIIDGSTDFNFDHILQYLLA